MKTISAPCAILGASCLVRGSGGIARRSLVGDVPSIHSSLHWIKLVRGFVSTFTMPTNLVPILACNFPISTEMMATSRIVNIPHRALQPPE